MVTSQTTVQRTVRSRPHVLAPLGWAIGLYLLWCAATYWFEGRVDLLTHPTVLGRVTYIGVANILIGTLGAAFLLRRYITVGATTPERLGFRSARRTALALVLAAAGGYAAFTLLAPGAQGTLIRVNLFLNVLPTSIAEMVVCWALLGGSVEALLRPRGRALAVVAAILVADLLFGVYHYAHSAPFNQIGMVLFLLVPGLVTSLVYFLGRDLYAAVVVQNFLGMIGVGQSADLSFLNRPLVPLYLIVLVAVATLLAADRLIIRLSPDRLSA
jgi:hypothetical protein